MILTLTALSFAAVIAVNDGDEARAARRRAARAAGVPARDVELRALEELLPPGELLVIGAKPRPCSMSVPDLRGVITEVDALVDATRYKVARPLLDDAILAAPCVQQRFDWQAWSHAWFTRGALQALSDTASAQPDFRAALNLNPRMAWPAGFGRDMGRELFDGLQASPDAGSLLLLHGRDEPFLLDGLATTAVRPPVATGLHVIQVEAPGLEGAPERVRTAVIELPVGATVTVLDVAHLEGVSSLAADPHAGPALARALERAPTDADVVLLLGDEAARLNDARDGWELVPVPRTRQVLRSAMMGTGGLVAAGGLVGVVTSYVTMANAVSAAPESASLAEWHLNEARYVRGESLQAPSAAIAGAGAALLGVGLTLQLVER